MSVKTIPDGYHTVTPYIMVKNASKLLNFLKEAFDAEVIRKHESPEGLIMNAEIRIGTSMVMLADPPDKTESAPASFYLYVNDTDKLYHQALKAGGTSIMEPEDKFYGDRNAGVKDPTGNNWWIATHIEDVPDEELEKRARAHK